MAKTKVEMTKVRLALLFLTILVVGFFGSFVSLYARGYRFDLKSLKLLPNGILVVKSDPDGASVYINGDLRTATNATIPLPDGTYDVEVKREGFLPWKSRLNIEKEIVTNVTAGLFRVAPSFNPLTLDGVTSPTASYDYTKVAYVNADGLWVMETVNLPIGFAKDPRLVTDGDLTGASWVFSPDATEILLTTPNGRFLLPANTFTPQAQRVNLGSQAETVLAEWEMLNQERLEVQTRNLPPIIADVLTRRSKAVSFSPDDNMILYTASASAEIPEGLIRPIPGASTQSQDRSIEENQTYVYDIKEDRNFLVEADLTDKALAWFPTSRHLVLAEAGRVIVMDYDGTNRQIVYSGTYSAPFAFPFASTSRILILTNLGADSAPPNLYSLTIK